MQDTKRVRVSFRRILPRVAGSTALTLVSAPAGVQVLKNEHESIQSWVQRLIAAGWAQGSTRDIRRREQSSCPWHVRAMVVGDAGGDSTFFSRAGDPKAGATPKNSASGFLTEHQPRKGGRRGI